MSTKPYDSLSIPPAGKQLGGLELLRAGIIEGNLGLSLRRGFDDPRAWGVVLAGVARDVARIFVTETGTSRDAVLQSIAATFVEELNAGEDSSNLIEEVVDPGPETT